MGTDAVLGHNGVLQGLQSLLGPLLGRYGASVAGGGVAHAQGGRRSVADLDVIIVFRAVVGRTEVNLECARGLEPRTAMRAAQGAVQQLDAVEVRGVGDSGDFRSHLLVFGIDEQALGRIVGARGRLLRQFLHADQLLVDNAQCAVGRLNERNAVVGVAHALVQSGYVGPHQFADGQARRVVGRRIHTQA